MALDLSPPPPEKRGPGRPLGYTAELGRRAIAEARKGAPKTFIADLIGVHRDTLYNWIQLGDEELLREDGEAPAHPELAEWVLAFRAARAEFAMEQLAKLTGATNDDKAPMIHATEWSLERIFPGEFGAKQVLEHTGVGGKDLHTGVVVMPGYGSTDASTFPDPEPSKP